LTRSVYTHPDIPKSRIALSSLVASIACVLPFSIHKIDNIKQFPRTKEVVIFTKGGHCFGDESGKDFCLIA
jgi:hypothetical protein